MRDAIKNNLSDKLFSNPLEKNRNLFTLGSYIQRCIIIKK